VDQIMCLKETGKEKWHECRATIQKEWGLGMFSADLRTRSSVSGRLRAWLQSVACVVSWCSCFRLPFLLSLNPSYSFLYFFFLFCLSSPPTFISTACYNGCDLVHKIFPCLLWRKPGLKSWLALRRICFYQSDNGAGFSATFRVSPVTSHFNSILYSFKPAAPRD
jgi:hypothetical protein